MQGSDTAGAQRGSTPLSHCACPVAIALTCCDFASSISTSSAKSVTLSSCPASAACSFDRFCFCSSTSGASTSAEELEAAAAGADMARGEDGSGGDLRKSQANTHAREQAEHRLAQLPTSSSTAAESPEITRESSAAAFSLALASASRESLSFDGGLVAPCSSCAALGCVAARRRLLSAACSVHPPPAVRCPIRCNVAL